MDENLQQGGQTPPKPSSVKGGSKILVCLKMGTVLFYSYISKIF